MKKLILLTLTFCYSINSFSQVGIGTSEPNASSQLEVKADDKGVLLPQVALQSTTDNNTISNGNVVSLLVYNTNNSDDLKACSNRLLGVLIVLIINFIEKINFNFKTP